MRLRYNFFLMVIGFLHLSYLSQAVALPNESMLQSFTNSAPRLLDIVQYGGYKPLSSAIYDQQLLKTVQSNITTYPDLFEQYRLQNCHSVIEPSNITNNLSATKVDEAALFRKTMRTQAMIQRCWISSMVVPGLGQIYNKAYWKVPCLYLGFALLGYKIYTEHREMQQHQRDALARNALMPHNKQVNPTFTKKRINECKRTRDLFIIIASAWYLLNILDAYAGGHDQTVNFEDDIQTKSTSQPTPLLPPTTGASIS